MPEMTLSGVGLIVKLRDIGGRVRDLGENEVRNVLGDIERSVLAEGEGRNLCYMLTTVHLIAFNKRCHTPISSLWQCFIESTI